MGKKSWNVYNADNVARVRRDETEARAREVEDERRQRSEDADRRLAVLRGETFANSTEDDIAPGFDSPRDGEEVSRKRRRIAAQVRSEKDILHVRSSDQQSRRDIDTLFNSSGHIDLIPRHSGVATRNETKERREEVDGQGMRLADAAGQTPNSGKPWYNSSLTDGGYKHDRVGRDVWGNEDPRRKEREKQRMDANDPLAAIKRGTRQLKQVEADKRSWRAQRERGLGEVEEIALKEHKHRRHRRRRHSDDGSLEDFNLDDGYKERCDGADKSSSDYKRGHRKHQHQHQRRRHSFLPRDRSRSPQRHSHRA